MSVSETSCRPRWTEGCRPESLPPRPHPPGAYGISRELAAQLGTHAEADLMRATLGEVLTERAFVHMEELMSTTCRP